MEGRKTTRREGGSGRLTFDEVGIDVDRLIAVMREAAGATTDAELADFMRAAGKAAGLTRRFPASSISHWRRLKRIPLADLWLFTRHLVESGKAVSLEAFLLAARRAKNSKEGKEAP